MKFSVAAGIFQIILLICFATLVDYGQHALPPHKRKGANPNITGPNAALAANDVAVYYPSKLILILKISLIARQVDMFKMYSLLLKT